MATTSSAYPIQTLREHATALEAAITLALANPKKDPVHRLRTYTRRIEAQLELLSLIPDLPDYAKSSKEVRKLLKTLRQAAGAVRDLDIERNLLKEDIGSQCPKKLREDARSLRRTLKQQRSAEADHLLKTLKMEQQKLAPELEQLLNSLSPIEDLSLSTNRLSELTLAWYEHNTPKAKPNSDPESLHAIRKSAKLARYIAETAADKLSRDFETLQQAGGTWHDLLTLTKTAKKHLGPHSLLTKALSQRRGAALNEYQAMLHKRHALAALNAPSAKN